MYHLISCSICKTASPPPANVGWSMSDSGISAVGRRRLEYELQKILTVGWGINYISHHYPLCASRPTSILWTQIPCPICQDSWWRKHWNSRRSTPGRWWRRQRRWRRQQRKSPCGSYTSRNAKCRGQIDREPAEYFHRRLHKV